eukprot:g8950.t1
MAGVGEQRGEKWWNIAKAIAYELKPFSMPTRQDVVNAGESVRTNVGQITAELKRVAPEAVRVVKGLEPLKALGVLSWLCGWAFFIWLEFGAVYFIISAMATIFVNLGEREDGEWSAYSVFNAGCKALLGTINAEQFEREIMRQNVAAPDRHDDDDFVFVEPEPEPEPGQAVDGEDSDIDNDNEVDDESDGDGGVGDGDGADGGAARGGRRKVSGKRARRGFQERRERQEERRLALQALGPQGEWN